MKRTLLYSILIVLTAPLLPTSLFAQEKARERVCNTEVKEVVEEYQLVATTMRRWLRAEGRCVNCDENCTEENPTARRDVRFLYTTSTRKLLFRKECVLVKRYLKVEWTNKNNLRAKVVGQKVKEIHSVKDATTKLDYKVLRMGRFLSKPGIVVIAEKQSALIRDFIPIMTEIDKRKADFSENAILIELDTWDEHPINK